MLSTNSYTHHTLTICEVPSSSSSKEWAKFLDRKKGTTLKADPKKLTHTHTKKEDSWRKSIHEDQFCRETEKCCRAESERAGIFTQLGTAGCPLVATKGWNSHGLGFGVFPQAPIRRYRQQGVLSGRTSS